MIQLHEYMKGMENEQDRDEMDLTRCSISPAKANVEKVMAIFFHLKYSLTKITFLLIVLLYFITYYFLQQSIPTDQPLFG